MKTAVEKRRARIVKSCIQVTCAAILISAQAYASGAQTAELRADAVTPEASTVTARSQNSAGPGLQQRTFRYHLNQGDTFDVTFPVTPEFNQTVTIQPDGYIALTGIGNLQVAGKTVPEVTELLRISYGKILHDPIINVVVKDFEKPYFIASGELSHPGKYELRSDTTLTEAVAIAGGFTENSKHSEVYLFRRVANNWVQLKRVDVKKMFKEADLSEDLHLQPGDMVFVPQNRYSKLKRYIPSPGLGMTVTNY